MSRPLYVTGMAFLIAMIVAMLIGFQTAVICAPILLILLVLSLLSPALRRRGAIPAALLAAAAAFSMFAAKTWLTVTPLVNAANGQTLPLRVQIYERESATDKGVWYQAGMLSSPAPGIPAGTKVMLWLPAAAEPQLFQEADGIFDLQESSLSSTKADGIYLQATPSLNNGTPDTAVVLNTSARPWFAPFYELRENAFNAIDKYTSGDVAGLFKGICFGDQHYISDGAMADFRASGMSYILAVAGFHLTVLVTALMLLLRRLRVNRRAAAAVLIPLLFAFAMVTGLRYSAIRAALMCGVVQAGALFRREPELSNSLGFAVLAILIVQPFAVYDVGFLMSAAAMWGLCYLLPLMEAKTRGKADKPEPAKLFPKIRRKVFRWGRAGVLTAVAAASPTIPIVALYFGVFQPLFPVSNILVEWAAAGVIAAGFIGALLAYVPFLGWAAGLVFTAGGWAAKYMFGISGLLAKIPFASIALKDDYLLLWVCLTPVVLIVGHRLMKGRGLRVTAAVAVMALAAGLLVNTLGMNGVTKMTVPAENGDTMVLLEQHGRFGLVMLHMSGNSVYDMASLLKDKAAPRLDFIWCPDYADKDAPNLLNLAKKVPVSRILLPKNTASDLGAATEAVPEGGSLTFWAGDAAELLPGGWLRFTLGDTRLLICPADGNAGDLSAAQRTAEVVVYDQTPPLHAGLLAAGQGVISCPADRMASVTKALPWGSYPIAAVTDGSAAVLMTRGNKDVTVG